MDSQEQKAVFSQIHAIFHEKIPFNKVLGIRIERLAFDAIALRLDMRRDLIGNFMVGSLHGGVISSLLDTAGGLMALLGIIKGSRRTADTAEISIFRKLGTIDLRIDYLRPGIGEFFIATSRIIRAGRRVTVTRMELHNDADKQIAVGTGTYIVS